MSTHGACYDAGQSGKCGVECPVYQDGKCEIANEILELSVIKCGDCVHVYCESDDYDYEYTCDHSDSPNHEYIDKPHRNNTSPKWCPLKLKQENSMNDKRFDFENKAGQVKGNAVTALDTAKNTIITLQQGKAVVAAVKGSLKKLPQCPEGFKALLETPYGDMIVGLVLHTAAPVLTGSPLVLKAVKAANVAGAVELSNSITFIQDAIEAAIAGLPGLGGIKEEIATKYAEAIKNGVEDHVTRQDAEPLTEDDEI
ncbi:MAG: hypothetical protein DRJ15_01555 [Bacteroidetes bacterium]|nr:MAG: hypothetical protein DRJ15_01555 [Bacteroidota bacterium]